MGTQSSAQSRSLLAGEGWTGTYTSASVVSPHPSITHRPAGLCSSAPGRSPHGLLSPADARISQTEPNSVSLELTPTHPFSTFEHKGTNLLPPPPRQTFE